MLPKYLLNWLLEAMDYTWVIRRYNLYISPFNALSLGYFLLSFATTRMTCNICEVRNLLYKGHLIMKYSSSSTLPSPQHWKTHCSTLAALAIETLISTCFNTTLIYTCTEFTFYSIRLSSISILERYNCIFHVHLKRAYLRSLLPPDILPCFAHVRCTSFPHSSTNRAATAYSTSFSHLLTTIVFILCSLGTS